MEHPKNVFKISYRRKSIKKEPCLCKITRYNIRKRALRQVFFAGDEQMDNFDSVQDVLDFAIAEEMVLKED
ncbi:MAG TPA: hypothetical protein HPP51_05560 [Planctomycetes bacterium]|nr:hypothetical protein [Planctomycetota bacterium]